MLVLSRKEGDSIVIGDDIQVKVVRIVGNRVTVGIDAPAEVPIVRAELREREVHEQPAAPGRRAVTFEVPLNQFTDAASYTG